MASTGQETPDANRTRTRIAFIVIGMGVVGIVVVSWVAMATTKNKDETSRLVFASVLPLIGTWVGGRSRLLLLSRQSPGRQRDHAARGTRRGRSDRRDAGEGRHDAGRPDPAEEDGRR